MATKNKKKLTGEKLDDEIDFNKLSLGDTVSESQFRSRISEKMKNDLFPEEDSKQSEIKTVLTKVETTSRDTNTDSKNLKGEEFVEKYKGKTAIGSDDVNSKSSGTRKDLTRFEGKSAIGSDDLTGKSSQKTASSPTTDYSEKIADAKDKIIDKASDWYNKLKTKMSK